MVQWVLDDLLADAGASAFEGLSDEQLRAALEAWHRVEAGVAAVKLRLLALADRSGTARAAGAASTAAWASSLTHQDSRRCSPAGVPGESPRRHVCDHPDRARRGPDLRAPRRGDRRRPAQTAGVARYRAARCALSASLWQGGDDVTAEATGRARRALEAVEREAAVVDAHEDALLREDERVAYDKTRLSLHDNGDGTVSGHFTVPDLHGQLLRKILESMTAPRRGRLGASQVQAGERSMRTDWDHARGLAFCELVEHLPTDRLHGKVAATLVVQLDKQCARRGAAGVGPRHRRPHLGGGGASPGLRSGPPPGGARRRVARARSRPVEATLQRGPTRGLRADPRNLRRGRVPAAVRLVRAASSAAVVGWGANRPGRCRAVVLVPPSPDPRPGARAPLPTRRIGHLPPTSLGRPRHFLETRHASRVLRRLTARCCLLWSHDLRLT